MDPLAHAHIGQFPVVASHARPIRDHDLADLGLPLPPSPIKNDSQSVGLSLNGSHLGFAKLHVAHSKDEKRP